MTPLQKAAQALIDNWDYPTISEYIAELRKALDAEIAQAVEPYGWLAHGLSRLETGKYAEDNARSDAKRMGYGAYAFPLYLHPPQPQATTAVPDLLKEFKNVMSWIDNWSPEFSYDPDWPDDRDKASSAIAAAQGEKP